MLIPKKKVKFVSWAYLNETNDISTLKSIFIIGSVKSTAIFRCFQNFRIHFESNEEKIEV